MGNRAVVVRAIVILILVWVTVWGIRTWAGSRRITVKMIDKEVARAKFEDWSAQETPPDSAEAARRDRELRNIAALVNRLDFRERQKRGTGTLFYEKLSRSEKQVFFDLTIRDTMDTMISALDAMPPDQRKRFVQDALAALEEGQAKEDLKRTRELGDEMLDKASNEGMRAYFEKASADTKMDLAPLMQSVNDAMQGMRHEPFR